MDLSKSYDFLKPEDVRERINIIGCGAVGSTVAENLARFGFTNISLFDFDVVEPKNVANQMFTSEDIGKAKVDAVANMIIKINPEAAEGLKIYRDGWKGQKLSGYVFLCVDNIDLRREIAEQNKFNNHIKAMFDFRMRLTDAQHYAADWSDMKHVEAFLNSMAFTHEEAIKETPVSACNIVLSVCPTVRIIVANGIANFVNFVKGKAMKKMILIDAFDYQLLAL